MSAMYISINLIIRLITEICQSSCWMAARAGGSQTDCRQVRRFILFFASNRSLSRGKPNLSKPCGALICQRINAQVARVSKQF